MRRFRDVAYVPSLTEPAALRGGDPAFDEIKNYTSFGYCWRKQSQGPRDPGRS
jgi:hypothetical protein